jgi:diguanylate cyclase (GGDEF)-like protein
MELERARRTKEKFCLIIIDIDFFKKVNDTYGHDVGDEILKSLADLMKKELRIYDLLSRFGGEEFFILLPGETIKKAKRIGERLRKSLWKDKNLKKYAITISLGVTEYKHMDNKRRMIKRADKALYESKHNGRNQLNVFL